MKRETRKAKEWLFLEVAEFFEGRRFDAEEPSEDEKLFHRVSLVVDALAATDAEVKRLRKAMRIIGRNSKDAPLIRLAVAAALKPQVTRERKRR